MRLTISLLLIFLNISNIFGQSKNKCECISTDHETGKESEVFEFNKGNKIMLCGSINSENNTNRYFEFVLFVCGKKTIIDFWDTSKTCEVNKIADTLYVNQIVDLPIGKNYASEQTAWKIDKLFFIDGQISIRNSLNRDFKKYNKKQITSINKSYNLYKPSIGDAEKMDLAEKLFVATISGDETSRKNLIEFKEKYQITGTPQEEKYNQLIIKLEQWDR